MGAGRLGLGCRVWVGWFWAGWFWAGWFWAGWFWAGWVWAGWVWAGWVWAGWVWAGWVWAGWVWAGWVWAGWVWAGWVWAGWVWVGWVWVGGVSTNFAVDGPTDDDRDQMITVRDRIRVSDQPTVAGAGDAPAAPEHPFRFVGADDGLDGRHPASGLGEPSAGFAGHPYLAVGQHRTVVSETAIGRPGDTIRQCRHPVQGVVRRHDAVPAKPDIPSAKLTLGIGQGAPGAEPHPQSTVIQGDIRRGQPGTHRPNQTPGGVRHPLVEIPHRRHDRHRTGGGCLEGRRCHGIDHGGVDLVTDPDVDRERRIGNGKRHRLGVEGGEVGLCSTAAHHRHDGRAQLSQSDEGGDDIAGSGWSLHCGVNHGDLEAVAGPTQLGDEVGMGGAADARDQPDPQRKRCNRECRIASQRSTDLETTQQLPSLGGESAKRVVGVDPSHPEAHHTPPLLIPDPATNPDMDAVGHANCPAADQHPVDGVPVAGEQRHRHGRLGLVRVDQHEEHVPGAGPLQIADLTFDPDLVDECPGHGPGDRPGQLGDGKGGVHRRDGSEVHAGDVAAPPGPAGIR